ncbi:MAG: hypothetical protein ACREMA_19950, partial [Longimicrobiales bacterium]
PRNRVTAAPRIVAFFESLLSRPQPLDPWEDMHHRLLRVDYCRLWAEIRAGDLADVLRHGVPPPCDHFQGRLLLLEVLLNTGSPDPRILRDLLREARESSAQALLREEEIWMESLTLRVSQIQPVHG